MRQTCPENPETFGPADRDLSGALTPSDHAGSLLSDMPTPCQFQFNRWRLSDMRVHRIAAIRIVLEIAEHAPAVFADLGMFRADNARAGFAVNHPG